MHGSEQRQKTALLITLWRKCGPTTRGGLRSALSEEQQPPPASSRHSYRLIYPSADSLLPLTTAPPDLCSLSLRTDTKKSNFSFYGGERDVSVSITLQTQKLWLMAAAVITLYRQTRRPLT